VTFQKTAIKDEIVNGLDGDLFYDEMEKITGEKPFTLNGQQYTVKTRYTHTQGNNDAAAYFLQRFKDMGYEASYQTFRYSSSNTQNIIATKRGTSSEIVVIGAHYDSISQDPQNLAPGCVDNGSGAEGVMQIAATYVNASLTRTVHFILFGAEEQGLLCSNYYVDNLDNTGYNIVYSLIMDMIGYSNVYHGVKIETSSSNANTVLGDLMASNIGYYAPNLTIARTTNYFGSDHVPFIDTGIPCFLAIEQDDTAYVGYHRTTDRINYLSVSQSIGILKGLSGTLYDLAA
jgi:Zn-dependent M28 family amino/carboxypeptidase